jgi:hypothetical protein
VTGKREEGTGNREQGRGDRCYATGTGKKEEGREKREEGRGFGQLYFSLLMSFFSVHLLIKNYQNIINSVGAIPPWLPQKCPIPPWLPK